MRLQAWNCDVSNPVSRAPTICVTRQMSAIVGDGPAQNGPAEVASCCSNAPSAALLQCVIQAIRAGSSRPTTSDR